MDQIISNAFSNPNDSMKAQQQLSPSALQSTKSPAALPASSGDAISQQPAGDQPRGAPSPAARRSLRPAGRGGAGAGPQRPPPSPAALPLPPAPRRAAPHLQRPHSGRLSQRSTGSSHSPAQHSRSSEGDGDRDGDGDGDGPAALLPPPRSMPGVEGGRCPLLPLGGAGGRGEAPRRRPPFAPPLPRRPNLMAGSVRWD